MGAHPVRRWLRSERPNVRADVVAGLPGAISSVPDGMAAAVLVGVNPIHGLYACFAGPVAGGLSSSTRLMVITTTTAAALAAGSALSDVDPADRPDALILLTLIAGVAMILAGVAKLGRYTRFVSHSVMIGFLTGISVNIFCGQISALTGAQASGGFALAKAVDVVTHPARIDIPSLLAGLGALGILAGLSRTRLAPVGALVALVVPTAVVILAGADSVARVEDVGEIPPGIPLPDLPNLSLLSFSLVTGALAVAAIVLVQGSGVAEAAPNRDGSVSNANQDFIAQGVGNLAAGFFRGQPVGGSVGQTALNQTVGGRTRWAPICAGLWMLVILAAFSGVVGVVAMPTLAAVLIFAAVGSLRLGELKTIMRTGHTSQIAIVSTFLATLFLPVAAAVGLGVTLSLLLQLNQEAMDLKVVELKPAGDGRWTEHPASERLPSHQTIVLDVYGSLLYAGSRTLGAKLPDPAGAEAPAVVLRLRGRTSVGATFVKVLADYAAALHTAGGRLYLSGVDHGLAELLRRTNRVDVSGPVTVFEAGELVGESTEKARHEAETWAVAHRTNTPDQ
ncbi:SulP family inorganic anion transporter [Kribbella capetownensis]|uniref:SulP family inorganic anion transporter n=1 Tax=Kribbella capetownensis TaxID=1572659 RepID=A0A4R0JUT5_9ACTN|nr:SulP family inorganic anion transporter [Kribbella capetownensis]TCC48956.1 SulP family inorganic anion transporter [Kribbella capetownensis]